MVTSYEIVLSVDVEAELSLPNLSFTEFAAMDGMTVPDPPLTPVADNVQVMLSRDDSDQVTPVAVPF
jgi:hypothetical protein